MNGWISRSIIIGLLAVILGLPLAWRRGTPPETPGQVRLVIITPHNEQIRYEMGRAFNIWHIDHFGQSVEIDWRVVGGSSDMVRLLGAQYESLLREGRVDQGAGYDVAFGGGAYYFGKLKKGVSGTGPDGSVRKASITQAVAFDEGFVNEVYPTRMIAGEPLYDEDGHWWGVVLTSFGIVYNRDALALIDLDEPTTWRDLADPKYRGWVALADPSHSGSIKVTYNAIVQRLGWDDGWKTLRRICANARYFASSSSQVPIDVSNGEAAAGMSIDFYGRYQGQMVGGNRLGYIAPEGQTVVNADPVAVLRGATNPEVAERFVAFLLSMPTQMLWNTPVGDEWGPEKYELHRPPVRRDAYERYFERMTDKENPFKLAQSMPEGAPDYYDAMAIVLHAMAIDVHEELQAAWDAICEETDPGRAERMRALFDELPFRSEELQNAPERWDAKPRTRTEDRLEWTSEFRANYREILEITDE